MRTANAPISATGEVRGKLTSTILHGRRKGLSEKIARALKRITKSRDVVFLRVVKYKWDKLAPRGEILRRFLFAISRSLSLSARRLPDGVPDVVFSLGY